MLCLTGRPDRHATAGCLEVVGSCLAHRTFDRTFCVSGSFVPWRAGGECPCLTPACCNLGRTHLTRTGYSRPAACLASDGHMLLRDMLPECTCSAGPGRSC